MLAHLLSFILCTPEPPVQHKVLQRLPAHAATVYPEGSGGGIGGGGGARPRRVSDEELGQLLPATMARNLLPREVADRLLLKLEAMASQWTSDRWTMGDGVEREAPRRTFCFDFASPRGASAAAFPELEAARAAVQGLVAALRPGRRWLPTYALANRYGDGSEGVGMHSDFLMSLG